MSNRAPFTADELSRAIAMALDNVALKVIAADLHRHVSCISTHLCRAGIRRLHRHPATASQRKMAARPAPNVSPFVNCGLDRLMAGR